MPKISEFYGISLYMYWFDKQKHQMPHFHARYGGQEAVFDLNGVCMEGALGVRASRLVTEWAQEKRLELLSAWTSASSGKEIPWVLPLQ